MNKVKAAHKHSIHHRLKVQASTVCGCFSCVKTFGPDEITEWIDHNQTALCPKCGIDSVIGGASGYPITEDFLREMEKFWFARTPASGPKES